MIDLYTKSGCKLCVCAKELLGRLSDEDFRVRNVDEDEDAAADCDFFASGTTMPVLVVEAEKVVVEGAGRVEAFIKRRFLKT